MLNTDFVTARGAYQEKQGESFTTKADKQKNISLEKNELYNVTVPIHM